MVAITEFASILQEDVQQKPEMKRALTGLIEKLRKCKKVVVVTGAGISVNSGIPVITPCYLIK